MAVHLTMPDRYKTSYRLSKEALRIIALLSEKLSINKTAVLEVAIRDMARHRGVEETHVS